VILSNSVAFLLTSLDRCERKQHVTAKISGVGFHNHRPTKPQKSTPTVVQLSGELDLATAPEMRELFIRPDVLDASAVRVDLANVTFMEPVCTGVLVAACKAVHATGGSFAVVCGDNVVRRVLQIAGLLDFFDVEEAL
jgi:anti-sigma B factor antagonist